MVVLPLCRLPQAHALRPSHDLAALYRPDHRLREMVERRILREKAIEHRTKQEYACALECLLVDCHSNLDPARCADTCTLTDPAHDWTAFDVANASDPALGDAGRQIAEQRQSFANSR